MANSRTFADHPYLLSEHEKNAAAVKAFNEQRDKQTLVGRREVGSFVVRFEDGYCFGPFDTPEAALQFALTYRVVFDRPWMIQPVCRVPQ